MALSKGARVGAYEIAEQIGAGGMGEVFRAIDTNLNRAVAIKVLPASFAQDADRLARFEREAQTLAALNHPNIAQVYGLEKDGAERALVMELVEGPTLADRIAAGPIPIDEAIAIAQQIAEGLESAHDSGIVHRDLKPANIKVRSDGTVKVLDFGLAKAVGRDPSSSSMPNSPTITTPAMTQAGIVLGTAAYMSPEQAKGRPVDRRTDIWAFGCVLFEMLTGARAFGGDEVSDVLVAIMRDEPKSALLPAQTPAQVRTLLAECLKKDVKQRLPHIGAARITLSQPLTGTIGPNVESRRHRIVEGLAWAFAGAALVVAALFMTRAPASPSATTTMRFSVLLPEGLVFPGAGGVPRFAVSPDGLSLLQQVARIGEGSYLAIRRLDTGEVRQLRSTSGPSTGEESQQAFWSPDGQSIAFFDERAEKLKRFDLQSGLLSELCDVPRQQYSGSWNADNVIILSTLATKGVQKVSASGGSVAQVTTVDAANNERSHLFPEFLGDGRHFVYLVDSSDRAPALYVSNIDGGAPKRIVESPGMARFLPPDRLLYIRGETLVSQQFDLTRLELVGEPQLVSSDVMRTAAGRVAVSASRSGVIVIGGEQANSLSAARMSWTDRSGKEELSTGLPQGLRSVRVSANGRYVVFLRGSGGAVGVPNELWVHDVVRKIETRIAADGLINAPVISADSTRVAFTRGNGTKRWVEQVEISGSSSGRKLYEDPRGELVTVTDFSADGLETLLIQGAVGQRGLYRLPLTPNASPIPYVVGFNVGSGSISPDGRYVAYSTTDAAVASGQVFVQTYPNPAGGRWPVSARGGGFPRWSRNGKEIFFVDAEGTLTAVQFSAQPRVELGVPTPLFRLPALAADTYRPGGGTQAFPYDVMPDGQRFAVIRGQGPANQPALTVLVPVHADVR